MTIGDFIKSKRKSKGITQKEMSSITGIAQGYLSDLENNKIENPSEKTIEKIGSVLSFTNADILKLKLNEWNEQYNKQNQLEKEVKKFEDGTVIDDIEAAVITQPNGAVLESNDPERKLSYIDAVLTFSEPEKAVEFILKQPLFMAYGGYDLKQMSDEEILEIANDMLFAMKLSLEKMKRNK